MLELARLFRARDLRRTLVLVSTSGATLGATGAAAWAKSVDQRAVDAVLVLGDLAGRRTAKPWVVPWSLAAGPAPLGLQRTVEQTLRAEAGPPGGSRASAQWARRALPFTVSEQGVIAEAGLPAVLIGTSGERGPAADDAVRAARLERFGRAVLRTVTAIDAAPAREAFASNPAGIVTMRNVLPDWAVRLLVGTLLLPAFLTALDGFFRVRRRRLTVGPWLIWLMATGLPVLLAWAWVRALGLTGALDVPDAPVLPFQAVERAGALALGSVGLVLALGWFGVRPLVLARTRPRGSPAAGSLAGAMGAVLCVLAAVVWAANPYAAALLLPATHLWLFASAPQTRLRGWVGVAALAAGLLPFALLALAYGQALALDPLELAWMTLLGAASGHVSVAVAFVGRDRARLRGRAGGDHAHAPAGGRRGRSRAAPHARPGHLRGARIARRHGVCAAAMTAAVPRASRLRRGLRVLSTALIIAGAVLLADAGATLLWQEPVSAVYAHFRQQALDDRLRELERAPLRPAEERALRRIPDPSRQLAFRARALERKLEPGDPMGRIVMPAIGVSEVFVEGTGAGDLRAGPGHYPGRRTRASAGRWRSPATARRTARPSAASTTSSAATGSSSGCRTGASRTSSSGRGSSPPPSSRSPTASRSTGSCSRPATRSTPRRSASSCSPVWSTRDDSGSGPIALRPADDDLYPHDSSRSPPPSPAPDAGSGRKGHGRLTWTRFANASSAASTRSTRRQWQRRSFVRIAAPARGRGIAVPAHGRLTGCRATDPGDRGGGFGRLPRRLGDADAELVVLAARGRQLGG